MSACDKGCCEKSNIAQLAQHRRYDLNGEICYVRHGQKQTCIGPSLRSAQGLAQD